MRIVSHSSDTNAKERPAQEGTALHAILEDDMYSSRLEFGEGSAPDLDMIAKAGRALSSAKLPQIAECHAKGTLVAFHLRTGDYVTAEDQPSLISKYEAKFGDDWGWFDRV